ncbi:SHOCT domain-containing protein [Niallia sp. BSM11]|uniref:SHOCT domain-containing protein n=1 Tax=Niallia sp. BSM11 TaxID=3391576 RepID=UPI00398467F3
MSKVLEFKAAGKTTVTLEGNFLRIKRKGLLNFANHGLDGEKSIDINNISGVQMKKAGALTNGYIQFVILGSRESKGGLMAATQDENTVMFAKKEQKMADEIKSYVEEILASKHQPTILSETKTDSAEEIRKFKALLDDGIISEEEFQQKKNQLLGL